MSTNLTFPRVGKIYERRLANGADTVTFRITPIRGTVGWSRTERTLGYALHVFAGRFGGNSQVVVHDDAVSLAEAKEYLRQIAADPAVQCLALDAMAAPPDKPVPTIRACPAAYDAMLRVLYPGEMVDR